jgi:AraC family transcriptional regulator of adaptative response / DNA-3-methyladenine glycosylase II
VTLHVAYQSPYNWNCFLDYLSARTVEGVDEVKAGHYRRTFSHEGEDGLIDVSDDPKSHALRVTLQMARVRPLAPILFRIRRMFDLHADVRSIESHLSRDPEFAQLIERRPSLRVPGGWDGFELAVRGILSQQISVEAARQLAGKLVAVCGRSSVDLSGGALSRIFPTPQEVRSADLSGIGIPESRQKALKVLAELLEREPRFFDACSSSDEIISRLRQLPGIGEWTIQFLALRAFREADAFPATDVAILRGATALAGTRMAQHELVARAEEWRPWRAYAAQHLWASGAQTTREP